MIKKINDIKEYQREYDRSVSDPEAFWSEQADTFDWIQKWDKVLQWDFDKLDVKWFINGKMNITSNCLDRHLETRGDQDAIIWEPNDPKDETIRLTFN